MIGTKEMPFSVYVEVVVKLLHIVLTCLEQVYSEEQAVLKHY